MSLNSYQKEKFLDFDTKLELFKWYRLDPNRPDFEELKRCIKLRIDLENDMEFDSKFTMFRKVETIAQMFDKQRNIDYWTAKMTSYRLQNPLEVMIKKVAPGKRR